MHLAFPYRVASDGRTATTDLDTHVRQLVEQLVFTTPGERVNRPELGSGALQLVFGPNGNEMATATQYLVQSALQRWLEDIIKVEAVEVRTTDARLEVSVQYLTIQNQERRVAQFSREV